MESIKQILMTRDNYSAEEADSCIQGLKEQISNEEITIDEALEELGVEPDYFMDLL
jgi:hypothetical protein